MNPKLKMINWLRRILTLHHKSIYTLLMSIPLVFLTACGSDETKPTEPPPPELLVNEAGAEESGLRNPITDTIEPRDYRLGNESAPVTIVVYGDFECGRCAQYAQNLEILRQEFGDEVQIIWRHLPDTQSHANASLALQAAEAAAAQGQFWDMHAMLYINQDQWLDLSESDFRIQLSQYAEFIGLDVTSFDTALTDGRYAVLVDEYQEQATNLGIVGIPTLIINGKPLNDRDDLFGLRGAIRLELLSLENYDNAPEVTLQEGVDYWAVILTERGAIEIDLLEDQAPTAVNNFIFLVEEGWYNGETFFLVIPEFYAQTGDPSETGRGHAGYFIAGEHANGLIFDQAGMVAFSHPQGELEKNSSQFFITTSALENHEAEWDGQFTIFGRVSSGLNVVENLTARNPGDPLRFPNPPDGDLIINIKIEER